MTDSRNLVYTGKRFEFRDGHAPQPPSEAVPRVTQRACRHFGLPHRLRDFRPVSMAGNGYRPGVLIELGPDQCRWPMQDGTMCGAKAVYPYCEAHAAKSVARRG